MKLIQYINDVVVDILNVRADTTIENIILVDSIPVFEHREGFNGILKYSAENGLYWDYEEVVISDEIPADELQTMLEEVL
jgi:hypothetical protein